ncbi:MAG: chemotaxis response regulator protein-glutamate methylesterase [Chloroflexota bacterium]|nr:chemotaxis response regulator protein-glutamate methylesterase [Chloroflexota bacterium]
MTIRVLVVDDSAFMRRVIGEAVAAEPDMELAGTAVNGLDALVKLEQLDPDVVTLDVEMPEMDGLTALRHLMARYPRPVVMLSSLTQAGAVTTIRALTIGAVDFVAKPSGSISLDFQRVRHELVHKVRLAARARVSAAATPVLERPPTAPDTVAPVQARRAAGDFERLVVIGASTGGPRALGAVVPVLPSDGRTAYVIVQHMPAGFTRSLAERLDSCSPISVREAQPGGQLAAGTAVVAPGDYHLRLTPRGGLALDQEPKVHGVRPSVDVTLYSAAQHFGTSTVAVILTGMGSDGAAGALSVRQAGGTVLAEDESSCVVWGMPRAVVERGGADRVVPLDRMATAISEALLTRVPVARAATSTRC